MPPWAEGALLCFLGWFWRALLGDGRALICAEGSHPGWGMWDLCMGCIPAFPALRGVDVCCVRHPLLAGIPAEVVEHSLSLLLVPVSHRCPASLRQRGWGKWERAVGDCCRCSPWCGSSAVRVSHQPSNGMGAVGAAPQCGGCVGVSGSAPSLRTHRRLRGSRSRSAGGHGRGVGGGTWNPHPPPRSELCFSPLNPPGLRTAVKALRLLPAPSRRRTSRQHSAVISSA